MLKKIALITGASAGFGEAIASQLIRDGYCVILAARRLNKLEDLRDQFGLDKVNRLH